MSGFPCGHYEHGWQNGLTESHKIWRVEPPAVVVSPVWLWHSYAGRTLTSVTSTCWCSDFLKKTDKLKAEEGVVIHSWMERTGEYCGIDVQSQSVHKQTHFIKVAAIGNKPKQITSTYCNIRHWVYFSAHSPFWTAGVFTELTDILLSTAAVFEHNRKVTIMCVFSYGRLGNFTARVRSGIKT